MTKKLKTEWPDKETLIHCNKQQAKVISELQEELRGALLRESRLLNQRFEFGLKKSACAVDEAWERNR